VVAHDLGNLQIYWTSWKSQLEVMSMVLEWTGDCFSARYFPWNVYICMIHNIYVYIYINSYIIYILYLHIHAWLYDCMICVYIYKYIYIITTLLRLLFRGGPYQNVRYIFRDPPLNVKWVAERPQGVAFVGRVLKIPSKCKLACSRSPRKHLEKWWKM
jgi:hypothetical protein